MCSNNVIFTGYKGLSCQHILYVEQSYKGSVDGDLGTVGNDILTQNTRALWASVKSTCHHS